MVEKIVEMSCVVHEHAAQRVLIPLSAGATIANLAVRDQLQHAPESLMPHRATGPEGLPLRPGGR